MLQLRVGYGVLPWRKLLFKKKTNKKPPNPPSFPPKTLYRKTANKILMMPKFGPELFYQISKAWNDLSLEEVNIYL